MQGESIGITPQNVIEVLTAAIAGKNEDNAQLMSYRIKGAKDNWIWVETDSTQMVLSEKDRPVMGFVWDVTDRYKTEEALRKNEDRLGHNRCSGRVSMPQDRGPGTSLAVDLLHRLAEGPTQIGRRLPG